MTNFVLPLTLISAALTKAFTISAFLTVSAAQTLFEFFSALFISLIISICEAPFSTKVQTTLLIIISLLFSGVILKVATSPVGSFSKL